MAEERDAPNSRLLFTDLDVSDKGRPLPDAPAPASPFVTPLTSITELASSLELDFEDDEGEDEFRLRHTGAAGTAVAEAPPVAPAKRGSAMEDDPELDLLAERLSHREIHQPAFPELARDSAASVPTWEEFTRAFRTAPEEEGDDSQFAARRWRGRRQGGYRFEDEADEDWDDPLLEEDVDILSSIEADELNRYDAEEDAVLDAEEAKSFRASTATQVINPRERLAALELAAAEGEADAFRAASLPPDYVDPSDETDFDDDPVAERPPTETSGMNPADTIYNMFSDIDIDTLWNEWMEKKKRAGSGRQGADSRVMDQFDDVDLEALWEKRKKSIPKGDTLRVPELAAGETLILEPGALDATSTVIMPPDEILAATARPEAKRASERKDAKAPADAAPELDDAEFAVDVDGLLEPGDTLPVTPLIQVVQPEVSDEEAFGDLQSLLDPEASADGEESEWLPGGDAEASTGPGGHVFTPGIDAPEITTDDVINDIDLDDEDAVNHDVSAPVIDDSAIANVRGPKPGTEEMQAIMGTFDEPEDGEAGDGAAEGEAAEEAVAVNPMDVFANMDDMDFDFSDDMDDEMRAMLDDDEELVDDAEATGGAEGEADINLEDIPPPGRLGKLLWRAGKLARRYLPAKALTIFDKVAAMVAWRENWWFYCDLLAAIIASASLAVIISYYVWYRK